MKKIYCILLFSLAAASCGKHGPEVKKESHGYILFHPKAEETKALLSDQDLHTNGSELKVYDFLSGFEGEIDGVSYTPDRSIKYIDDAVRYDSAKDAVIWDYVNNGTMYPWTSTGEHDFFAYLLRDAKAGLNLDNLLPGTSFNQDNTTLTIPQSTITIDSPQFDFLYSDKLTRNAADIAERSVVNLGLKHFFTALSVQFVNKSSLPVTLLSIRFEIPNKCRADIPFSVQTTPVFSEKSVDTNNYFVNKTDLNYTLPAKVPNGSLVYYDLFTGATNPAKKTFRLCWMMEGHEIAPTNPFPEELKVGPEAQREFYATDSLIVLSYKIGNGKVHHTRAKFPATNWEGGKRYHMNLQFLDKQMIVDYEVLPWDYYEVPMAFEDKSITATGLAFKEETYSATGNDLDENGAPTKTITTKNGMSVVGEFNIYNPIGGMLHLGISGMTRFFDVSMNGSGSGVRIDPMTNNGKVVLTITPKTELTRTEDCKIRLHFSVEQNNRSVNADSEINRENFTIILPK